MGPRSGTTSTSRITAAPSTWCCTRRRSAVSTTWARVSRRRGCRWPRPCSRSWASRRASSSSSPTGRDTTTGTRWTSPASRRTDGSRRWTWARAWSARSAGTSSTPNGGARSSRASTGTTTSATTALSRRLPEPSHQAGAIPLQVAREPLPEAEPALTRRAVAPCRRHLRDSQAEQVSLDRQLDAELKASGGLDRHLVEEPLRVETEVARRVVYRYATEPVKRQDCRARHSSLEEGGAGLPGASHVT